MDVRLPVLRSLRERAVLPAEYDPFTLQPIEEAVLERVRRRPWGDKASLERVSPPGTWWLYGQTVGAAPTVRVTADNPAVSVCAVVLDCDWRWSAWESAWRGILSQAATRGWLLPSYIEESVSGNFRIVWLFDRRINVAGNEHAKFFATGFVAQLRYAQVLPAVDSQSYQPYQYFLRPVRLVWVNEAARYVDAGGDDVFAAWAEAARRAGAERSVTGNGVDWDELAKAVEEKWPGRWKGEFRPGARGVRFWDDTADNPTAAVLTEEGVVCWTGDRPFISWTELVPELFERRRRVREDFLRGIYYDGSYYWRRAGASWEPYDKDDIKLHLRAYGLSSKASRGGLSEVDSAIVWIQENQRVRGAGPFVCYPPGPVEISGSRWLNIANLRPVEPVADPEFPVSAQHFPFIAEFISGLFTGRADTDLTSIPPDSPLHYFLAWTKIAYTSLRTYTRTLGQVLYLVGPRNNGKTLLAERILQPLLGRESFDPSSYLTGESNFQDQLFCSYLLVINDKDGPKDDALRKRMLARLKELTVNPRHTWNRKYMRETVIEWTGRIVVTTNDDPGSLGLLPELTPSIIDKIMIFGTYGRTKPWPPIRVIEDTIERELPYFAAWLERVYDPPDRVLVSDRFQVASYIDPRVAARIYAYDPQQILREVLYKWQETDAVWRDDSYVWRGTLLDLYRIATDEVLTGGALRWMNAARLNEYMINFSRENPDVVEYKISDGGIIYTIRKLKRKSATPTNSST